MSKLEWEKLLCEKIFISSEDCNEDYDMGKQEYTDDAKNRRPTFQRDVQRIMYSKKFRRLSRKTQVKPVVQTEDYEWGKINDHIRNRLFHSLEVSTVAKNLVHNIFTRLLENENGSINRDRLSDFYEYLGSSVEFKSIECDALLKVIKDKIVADIQSVIESASYIHDIGNPPFGHGGEDAIKSWFQQQNGMKAESILNNDTYADIMKDMSYFDGNAQAVHIAINELKLSYPAVASMVKYPWSVDNKTDKDKFGYFKSDEKMFDKAFDALGLKSGDTKYIRHPLSYILEMADDICYSVADWEDAYHLWWDDIVPNAMQVFKSIIDVLKEDDGKELFEKFEIFKTMKSLLKLEKDPLINGLKCEINKLDGVNKEKFEILLTLQDQDSEVIKESLKNKIFESVRNTLKETGKKVVRLLVDQAVDDFVDNYEDIMNGKNVRFNEWVHQKAIEPTQKKKEQYIYPKVNEHSEVFEMMVHFLLDKYIFKKLDKNDNKSNKFKKLNDINKAEDIHCIITYIVGMTDPFTIRAFSNYPKHKYKEAWSPNKNNFDGS